jgi:hypothetical protein
MMTCKRCRKGFEDGAARCPHCGHANPGKSGVFQTSTVLISTGAGDLVYRSVEEVPAGLRSQLMKSTNGSNSATILIADRRGRQEIARAMRNLPGPTQRRLIHSILGSNGQDAPEWLTPARKRLILVLVSAGLLAVVAAVFSLAR